VERIEPLDIVDALVDTENWLNWNRFFRPISGHDTKLHASRARYVVTAFCYGCNLGPSQTARSLEGFDRRQIPLGRSEAHHRGEPRRGHYRADQRVHSLRPSEVGLPIAAEKKNNELGLRP
jgi:hypothetical protein